MNTNFHDNRHTPDTLVVIDTYDWYENDKNEGEQIDAKNEAALLTGIASTHGRRVGFETITNENDRERFNSYKRMDHNIHSMNGNRSAELIEIITDLVTKITYERPEKVIVVSDHEAFQVLCSVAEQNGASVQIWTSGSKLPPPRLRTFDTRPLIDVLPTLRKTKRTVVVRLDVENHLITLNKRGCSPDALTYLEAIRKTVADLGNIINIQAWADWEHLRRSLGRNYQREFEQIGVKTFYQINEPGKSTSDMAMVGSIHESLDHDNGLDIYVIGTGDADFTPVVESIRNQGKRAVVVTLDGSLGKKLKQAADEIRYLDAFFSLTKTTHPKALRLGKSNKGLAATLLVAHTLRKRHWEYIFMDRLPSWLPADWVRDAVEQGLLIHRTPSETNSVVLNIENPVTKQATYFEKWVEHQIHKYLVRRKYDYVDTSFLARGMQMDDGCKDLGIGRNRSSAVAMLEACKEAQLVVKKTIDHPKHPGRRIDIWLQGEPREEQPQSTLPAQINTHNPTQLHNNSGEEQENTDKKPDKFDTAPSTAF